jgi:hypothetical protein
LKIHIESVAKRQPRADEARDERISVRASASSSKGPKPPCPIVVAI